MVEINSIPVPLPSLITATVSDARPRTQRTAGTQSMHRFSRLGEFTKTSVFISLVFSFFLQSELGQLFIMSRHFSWHKLSGCLLNC